MGDDRLALFLLLAQTAERELRRSPDATQPIAMPIGPQYDLATIVPSRVHRASDAADAYKLFFVFEGYLRELVVEVLTKENAEQWWDKVPDDVRTEIQKLEDTEEIKAWMALGSRDKASLMTFPQLLRVIDHCWKLGFDDLLRDKSLVHEARLLSHLRNTICHMSGISDEEADRVRQVMRDWFRIVAP